ncbi:HIT domain-containing protein [Thalassotalea sp. LPB0316]|uniref:HIT domain-containing protein n=1 Tax=Thalassotalea sp. LPB0316 TaxID=2769490 RepID=UPI0018670171|nr:HIT domain-containing protein [Thalassotalea sp. LPB0316]QOL25752.1 HIT domain-containing protein [Thalassotalea sp. LPB0316]
MSTTESFKLHEMLEADTVFIKDLPLCRLVLMNNANHPWCILIPRVEDVVDIYQMDWQDQQQFLNESSMLSEVMMQLFGGKKMNGRCTWQYLPQLHVHNCSIRAGY